MTAIGVVAGPEPEGELRAQASALLSSGYRWRGGTVSTEAAPGCALAGAMTDWEPAVFGATQPLERSDGVIVALDGCLYYQADLRRKLSAAGVASTAVTDRGLVAQACAVWGADCIQHLEGDYAFACWDSGKERLILGRDHLGRRPLHYAVVGASLVVASAARSVAGHPRVNAQLNLPAVVSALSGLLGGSLETGFIGVFPVPAATTIVWQAGQGIQQRGAWHPPAFRVSGAPNLKAGGEELRELIVQAAAVRLSGDPVAIWLSGGADSPAVLAGACLAMERGAATPRKIAPITVSYPEGDMGREDHFVQAIADRFSLDVNWIPSATLGLFGDIKGWAAHRDDPYAHTFEAKNRTMARKARHLGAGMALDGYGGDQLFGISKSYLADYLVRGRITELVRELQGYGDSGFRTIVRLGLLPWLPERVRYWQSRARGRSDEDATWQTQAPWIQSRWREDPLVRRRLRREPPRRFLESPSAYESRWYVETPYFPRAISWATGMALDEGVELRSPLLDRRIVEFAASRPVSERGIAGQPKPLLREAMRGVLPDWVIAPRPSKTGTPGGEFQRSMRVEAPALATALGPASAWRLSQMGLVDVPLMLRYLDNLTTMDHLQYVQLYLALTCEEWLRQFPY